MWCTFGHVNRQSLRDGSGVRGSGVGVQSSGFGVQCSGSRVQGSGFRVQGSGYRVQGSGFRVQGSGLGVDHGHRDALRSEPARGREAFKHKQWLREGGGTFSLPEVRVEIEAQQLSASVAGWL